MILAPTLSASAGSGAAIVRPTFSRDFAGEKTLNNGTGPAITFTRGSDATYFNAAGVLTTATTNEPRFDHNPSSGNASLGLLIEEARTNSIRNSQAGGSTNGVIGSGGALPTNWERNGITGISYEVVGSGTSNGLNYVDIKASGTNTSGSTGFLIVRFDPPTQVTASSGQSWTGSFYAALTAGSTSGITQGPRIMLQGGTAAGAFVESSQTNLSLTSSLQRFTQSRTLSGATTERASVLFYGEVANGQAIDLTLRIAAPQLEQGAFPTSYIPTTTAAATRAADSAVVTPISSFYNASEGTLLAEAISNNVPSSIQFPKVADIGANPDPVGNSIRLETWNSGGNLGVSSYVTAAGSNTYEVFDTASGVGQVFKAATAYKTDDFRTAVNGSLFGSADTSGALPSAGDMTTLGIGQARNGIPAGTSFYVRKVAYWPKRLTNALLEQLTT